MGNFIANSCRKQMVQAPESLYYKDLRISMRRWPELAMNLARLSFEGIGFRDLVDDRGGPDQ